MLLVHQLTRGESHRTLRGYLTLSNISGIQTIVDEMGVLFQSSDLTVSVFRRSNVKFFVFKLIFLNYLWYFKCYLLIKHTGIA